METLVVQYGDEELRYTINKDSKGADKICNKILDAFPDCPFWFE